jgi:hypothetical protein
MVLMLRGAASWPSLANVPGHFTWEPDPQSGSESRVSTDDTGRIGSVTLKIEDAWPPACLLF